MFATDLLVDGQPSAASNGAVFERRDPATGDTATRAAAATVDDAERACAAAQRAFPAWAATAPGERRALLLQAADTMEQYRAEFVARGVREAGGSPIWYQFNVTLAANMLREAAGMTTQVAGEVIPSDVPGSLAMGVRQPCGVVLGIAPWNAPVILGTRAVAMPLACGNTVVLKASEQCPALHRLIGTVFDDAGFPPGVVNVITNAPDDAAAVVERLIAHPAVRRINFTGSTAVGRIVAQQAARHLKPVLLELGGKNPVVVLDDADLDAAVEAAAFSAFFNQGQICMSADRIIVDRKIAPAFLDKFAAKAATLKAAHADAPLAGMVDPAAAERVARMVRDAVERGATVLPGVPAPDGNLLQPAIVDGVTPEMAVYREEAFGPIVSIVRFDTDEEAIALANDSEYGLSAAVFSRDIGRAMAVARRIESGICHINGPTVHDEAQMPFGGVKASGYGRFGGKAAIAEFTDLRWITVQTTPRHYPI
ncbi:vanillin dehydrogenase [Pseudoduganella flava]|uniref:Salicylaldehyde dehydrogenase n=1 Tax=Pseudoduganella flava TaxID=871742 RepID=A0A562PIK4_9BURK|nr:aldehyde dehydrogenase [Pseudoduganella flava]QGZ37589.1 aldehyde dehydrogenase family protein [Pseudoduganella flava]TWI44050.1 vanillin dehydrogenase [Pseudoduganella flava]